MLYYCEKCGRTAFESKNETIQTCDYCRNTMEAVPEEFLGGISKLFIKEELKNQFINEYIKSSPKFDQYLFEHREEDMYNKRMADKAIIEHGRAILDGKRSASNVPKCPTCKSTNIRKIGAIESGASIFAFGLYSKKINKTFKCSNCGYTW